jgi:hypothetical protein
MVSDSGGVITFAMTRSPCALLLTVVMIATGRRSSWVDGRGRLHREVGSNSVGVRVPHTSADLELGHPGADYQLRGQLGQCASLFIGSDCPYSANRSQFAYLFAVADSVDNPEERFRDRHRASREFDDPST